MSAERSGNGAERAENGMNESGAVSRHWGQKIKIGCSRSAHMLCQRGLAPSLENFTTSLE